MGNFRPTQRRLTVDEEIVNNFYRALTVMLAILAAVVVLYGGYAFYTLWQDATRLGPANVEAESNNLTKRIPTLVGYGCNVGQGPDDLRTLYAFAEDDFPRCRDIESYE